jgi:hypothetical protein
LDGRSGVGLRSLKRSTEGTVPNELSSNTEGTGYTEEYGVVLHLVKSVVGKKYTRVGVDVGPGVLGLASLEEDIRNEIVDLANEPEHLVVGEVLQSELALSGVTRIGLAEDSVTVSRNDLARLEGGPYVLLDGLVGSIFANLGLHLAEPDKDFLVSKTVERTSETVESSGVSKERI